MSRVASLILRVDSDGFVTARQRMRDMAAEANSVEQAHTRLAATAERASRRGADAAENVARRREESAQRALARENEAWNNALQKALARDERRAESAARAAQRQAEVAERAAQRSIAAQEKASARENEMWNNAIQRAKARAEREAIGRDGVLPIRPSLQRIEGMGEGVLGAIPGFGTIAAAGSVAGVAVLGVEKLFETIHKVIGSVVEYESTLARLGGVTGGVDEAREKFEALEKVSDRTIFTEKQMADAFIHLSQIGIEPSNKALMAYSNVASAFGVSINDVAGTVGSAAAGMYRGLRQFGIRASEEGDHLKVTFRGQTQELQKSQDAIAKYMEKLGETSFAGAAAAQMDTMGGTLKEFGESWEKLYRTIGESVIGDSIKATIEVGTDAVNVLKSSIEALLYTVSKRPKGMSAEKRENLAGFMASGDRWGSSEMTDEEAAFDTRIRDVMAGLEKSSVRGRDAKLKEYLEKRATLQEGMAKGYTFDPAALDQLDRQYAEDVNGEGGKGKSRKQSAAGEDIFAKYERENQRALDKAVEEAMAAGQREYEAIKTSLANKEDAEHESYTKRAKFLADYTGPDQQEMIAQNEAIWNKHLDKLAKDESDKQEARVKKHDSMFLRFATAGDRYLAEEREALGEYQAALDERAISDAEYEHLKAKLHQETNAKIVQSDLELKRQSAENAEMLFGNLATVMENAAGKQSGAYQVMFALQKSFAVAAATLNMGLDISNASATPWPGNIPLMIKAAADGAQIMAMITSANYSGAHDLGGSIPAGSIGLVGERGPEFVRGPADVTSRADTARILAAAGSASGNGQTNLRIVNAFDGSDAVRGYLGSTQGERHIVNVIRRNSREIQAMVR